MSQILKNLKSSNKNLSNLVQRHFSSQSALNNKSVAQESLQVFNYRFPEFLTRVAPVQTTTLNNGFQIVTEPRIGETAAVGVFIAAGSRHENPRNNGVAHFLEHMYFKGTKKRNAKDLEVEFENTGSLLNAHTSREYTAFTSHCLKNDVDRSVECLSDILLNSQFSRENVEAEKSTILREMEEVNQNIDEVLFDQLHATAFPQSALGYPILGSRENVQKMTREQMIDYRNTYYTAPRMILVGVGNVKHEELVKLGEKYFSSVPKEPVSETKAETPHARYIGGDVHIYNPDIPLLHLAIGFEGPSLSSSDILTLNVIQLLMGTYDRSNGAGKYVTTQFCSRIADMDLARSVVPFNHAYSDKGLFGIHIISDGGKSTDTLMVETVSQMSKFCYKVNEDELSRAKNVLKNQMLATYEGSLSGVLEEVGKQMVFYGRRPNAAEMFARIDAITANDVKRVATKYIFDKDPVVAAIGQTEEVVDYSWLKLHTYSWKK